MSSFLGTKIAISIGMILCGSTLSAQQYAISTVAGGGQLSSSISASTIRLPISGGVAVGGGDVYFSAGNSVMKADANGIWMRIAGTGQYGYSGDGGAAPQRSISLARGSGVP